MSLLSCPVCLKPNFDGVDSLRSSLINVATTHISCPVCNELFLGLDKLTIHLFSHISTYVNRNEVEVNKEIATSQDLNAGLEVLLEAPVETNNTLYCDICNYKFSDETILDLHKKLLHQSLTDTRTGKYNYHCHLCSKQFKMRGSLMVHLRVAHYGFIQNDRKADDDNSTLKASDNLEEKKSEKNKTLSMPIKTQDNKHWECEVCLKSFTTKYFLKKHKRLHTGEMPYYCSQCNKYFTFQQSYHKHMLYHSDEKPHTCTQCGRAFKELSTLHNHERIHSGERPFSCETCGKSFRQRVSYLVHRRIHTGVMPYQCANCKRTFRYKVSQRSHKCSSNSSGCANVNTDLDEEMAINREQHNIQLSMSSISEDNNDTQCDYQKLLNYENYVKDNDTGVSSLSTENSNPDFFALVLSPVVSDVESLCLSGYSEDHQSKTFNNNCAENLETINEESFKELLYGSTNK